MKQVGARGLPMVPDQKVAERVAGPALAAPGAISPRPAACPAPFGVL